MRWFLLLSVFILSTANWGQSATAGDTVLAEWNSVLLESIANEQLNPGLGSRATAIMHLSAYDAVNGIARSESPSVGYKQYHVDFSGAIAGSSREAAAAAAAHRALSSLFPTQQTTFDNLLTSQLGLIPDSTSKSDGISWGESVADQILLLRSNDGHNASEPYSSSGLVGRYSGSWGSQHIRAMTPFAINSTSAYASAGPPDLTSQEYALAVQDVESFGSLNSTTRSADQTEIAQFWKSPNGTSRPSGQWLQISQVYAENEDLSLHESARMYGLLGIAMTDAAIVTWENKSANDFWRPRDAVQNADQDGNGGTFADPNWEPLNGVGKQGSSPEHTSGQSTFNGAGSEIMAAFHGSDNYAITFSLDTLGPTVTRSFTSFSQAAEEAGRSRIYLGTHFEFTNQASLAMGRSLGQYVLSTQLLAIPEPSTTILSLLGVVLAMSRRAAKRVSLERRDL